MRTPLHAIGSQLELIRIVTAPPYLDTISMCYLKLKIEETLLIVLLAQLEPLLAVAEVCVTSLREVTVFLQLNPSRQTDF